MLLEFPIQIIPTIFIQNIICSFEIPTYFSSNVINPILNSYFPSNNNDDRRILKIVQTSNKKIMEGKKVEGNQRLPCLVVLVEEELKLKDVLICKYSNPREIGSSYVLILLDIRKS